MLSIEVVKLIVLKLKGILLLYIKKLLKSPTLGHMELSNLKIPRNLRLTLAKIFLCICGKLKRFHTTTKEEQ